MLSVCYSIYLYVVIMVLALFEIQIEGKYGWAEKLPCWRPRSDSFLDRIYRRLMNDKILTGYHLSLNGLILVFLHIPFFANPDFSWTLIKELEVFSVYFLLTIFWDFLWFVWNPSYGLKRFKSKYIRWHEKWIGCVPKDYVSGVLMSLIFAIIATYIGGGINVIFQWIWMLIIFTGLTFINCITSHQ